MSLTRLADTEGGPLSALGCGGVLLIQRGNPALPWDIGESC